MNQLATMAAPHRQALEPTTLTEAMEFARLLANSTMVPREFQGKPGNVLIALQWGREVGLGPLQAVQNIAVINGRPSLWGDAMLALVRGHPACAAVREGVAGDGDTRHGWCEVTRRGEPPQRRTFSVADAKRAKLWGKAGPWTEYPDRMLQLRARGFATRDVFPDALRGVITAEEAADMPPARGPTIMGEAAPAPAPAAREEPQGAPDHPPPERLPMISPDGALVEVPRRTWLAAAERALSRLEDAGAVREWRRAMGPHIGSVAQTSDAAMAAQCEALIEERLGAVRALGDAVDDDFPGVVSPKESAA
jgi:hypothetical protein